jgi:hypothetical protein
MGRDDDAEALRWLRAQLTAVERLHVRWSHAAALGAVPEGWKCTWCVEAAAAELRQALSRLPGRQR